MNQDILRQLHAETMTQIRGRDRRMRWAAIAQVMSLAVFALSIACFYRGHLGAHLDCNSPLYVQVVPSSPVEADRVSAKPDDALPAAPVPSKTDNPQNEADFLALYQSATDNVDETALRQFVRQAEQFLASHSQTEDSIAVAKMLSRL